MSKPMTAQQAAEVFPDDTIGHTCSMTCQHCEERVWFAGERHDQSYSYICPHCNDRSLHILVLESRKRIDTLLTQIRQVAHGLPRTS